MKALRRLTSLTSMEEISRIISDITEAWNNLARDKFLERRVITTAVFAGANVIGHALDREVSGYIITKQNAAASFYLVNNTKQTITLYSSANVTIQMEVW